jgi:4-carboxymuconolactone decarboxylase
MAHDDDALFKKGLPIRKAVLGADYVESSLEKADDFMMAFQRITTSWAWGMAWGDPTLDRKTRSIINLAMLTAMGKIPEVKLHVKGALNNGVSVDEIRATLCHAAAYAGIPAALDAFKATHEVLIAEGAIKPKAAKKAEDKKAEEKPAKKKAKK